MPNRSEPEFDTTPDAGRPLPSASSGAPLNGAQRSWAPTGSAQKGLWITVGVLGTAVVALAATLASQHLPDGGRDANSRNQIASLQPANAQRLASSDGAPGAVEAPVIGDPSTNQYSQRNSAKTIYPQAQSAPERVAKEEALEPRLQSSPYSSARAPQAPYPQPPTQANYAVQEPSCQSCGRVESVRALRHAVPTTGVGAVAGGVLGALVGNRFGHGNGRVATTVLGAAGGGYLGNTFEANSRARTDYQVRVRMENGSIRTFERADAVAVGTPVTVEGHGFRLGHAAVHATTPSPRGYRVVQQPAPQQGVYSTRASY
jgi:outer membrane lipoprotein SlyB